MKVVWVLNLAVEFSGPRKEFSTSSAKPSHSEIQRGRPTICFANFGRLLIPSYAISFGRAQQPFCDPNASVGKGFSYAFILDEPAVEGGEG